MSIITAEELEMLANMLERFKVGVEEYSGCEDIHYFLAVMEGGDPFLIKEISLSNLEDEMEKYYSVLDESLYRLRRAQEYLSQLKVGATDWK
jgi:hypothetical protein